MTIVAVPLDDIWCSNGVVSIGGLPAQRMVCAGAAALIDDTLPIGQNRLCLILGNGSAAALLMAERCAELIERHGVAGEIPQTTADLEGL